jgi:hypothetical protein
MSKYRIINIQMRGNEHGKANPDVISAEFQEVATGAIVMHAALGYILAEIREHKYDVEGVTVSWSQEHGINCSTVKFQDN